MRVSQNLLKICVSNINHLSSHKASITFTQGCGVYLHIDGVDYEKKMKDGSFMGITNKEAYEIMKQFDAEIMKNALVKEKETISYMEANK